MPGSLPKNEIKTKKVLEAFQKMDSKRKMIFEIKFKINDEVELQKKVEQIKKWYNEHWFMNKDVLVQQVKKLILDHLEVELVEQHENI